MSEFEYDLLFQNVKLFQRLGDPRSPTGLRPGPTGGLPSPRPPQDEHPSHIHLIDIKLLPSTLSLYRMFKKISDDPPQTKFLGPPMQ